MRGFDGIEPRRFGSFLENQAWTLFQVGEPAVIITHIIQPLGLGLNRNSLERVEPARATGGHTGKESGP
jgi:hypothetical protein